MATQHSRGAARLMISPAVLLLLGWMIIPLAMTLYFSFLRYNLLMPGTEEWTGLTNYRFFLTDPAFLDAIWNTLLLVGGVFVLFSGLLYFIFMAAWLNLFLLVGYLPLVTTAAGLVALEPRGDVVLVQRSVPRHTDTLGSAYCTGN